MADPVHVAELMKGVVAWNEWRNKNPNIRPDLSGAKLHGLDLSNADLSNADLSEADLHESDLHDAAIIDAALCVADLSGANLSGALLVRANLSEANLSGAKLSGALLNSADLSKANLNAANLHEAKLCGADLHEANLSRAKRTGGYFQAATLLNTDFTCADLTGCRVYGISAWGVKLNGAKQQNLVITPENEPTVTVDNIEVAQFVYLLLHNEKIRDVIDTIGKKGVLLLGRFTEGRMVVLERLREKLRQLGFVPMVFNFDRPETKDFTETVRVMCGLSHFVIVDITNRGRHRSNCRRPCRTTWSRSLPSFSKGRSRSRCS